jgi:hypothetical protein
VADEPEERDFHEHYLRGLGMAARANSLAFGYSVAITVSFAMLEHFDGAPRVLDIFLFVIGAGAAFAVVNAGVTRGFRRCVAAEPRLVMALATSFSFLSISAALGAATLLGWLVGGWVSWLVGPFLATLAYLFAAAIEIATARTAHLVAGTDVKETED